MKRSLARPSALFARFGLPATILAVGLFGPGQALALEPGVHFDPGSPANKQYAIALGTARGSSGDGPSPLFGSGIVPSHSSVARGGAPGQARSKGALPPGATQRVSPVPRAAQRARSGSLLADALHSPSSGLSGVAVGVIAPAILLVLGALVAAGRRIAVRPGRST